MKVLVITNMYPTRHEPWFGVFVAEQVADLRAIGLEVEVLAFDGRRQRLSYLRAALESRSRVARSFDLVHAHYGLTGAVALLQPCRPVVTTFHGSDAGFIRWQLGVSRLVARLSEPIVVASYLSKTLKLRRATVIPAGVDIARFHPRDRHAAREALGLDPDAHYVLFPGDRRNARKRADVFDAVLREARRTHPRVRAVALEGLTREQSALMLAAVDVTLMTSDWEGAPVTIKESLACETPVVSVAVGDVPDTVRGLPGCVVCNRDARELADGVLRALSTGPSEVLRERAREFSRERMARKVADLYERVASRPG